MVTSLGVRWNKIYPSVEKLHLRLEENGCISDNDGAILLEKESED
jgi:hypothetical protein